MRIIKDESVTTFYGFFECPVCHSTFYGGGEALHKHGCTESNYDNCILHVGQNCREWNWTEDVIAVGNTVLVDDGELDFDGQVIDIWLNGTVEVKSNGTGKTYEVSHKYVKKFQ